MTFVLWVESCAEHETSKKNQFMGPYSQMYMATKEEHCQAQGSLPRNSRISVLKLGEIKQILHAD